MSPTKIQLCGYWKRRVAGDSHSHLPRQGGFFYVCMSAWRCHREKQAALRAAPHFMRSTWRGYSPPTAAKGVSAKRCARSRTVTLCASLSSGDDMLAFAASRTWRCGIALCERHAAFGVAVAYRRPVRAHTRLPAGYIATRVTQRAGFTSTKRTLCLSAHIFTCT